ncbi:MAG TPA: glycosyl hydrolase 53 family protein [Microbacterium sp.]|uniref:glycosyl hydrolase 53 family protein n=1 Tax=Microbacterium sp. TaxID=51671 RepID=UPI002C5DC9D3|nr:glycosyl hydrolase 53 family protein [Microbacterium sp.]HWI29900.1 glycosyl hydrolase 53 family protein [Microbacterium sp.]
MAAAAAAAALSLTSTALSAAAYAEDPGPVEAGITVDKVDGLSPDFLKGVDVSTVESLEASGVVFRDSTGAPADLFTILAENGVNSVRIRVWNDPFDAEGRGYGGGNVDVDRAVQIGQRATAAGLDVLVDFHYSDFWADPGRQLSPKAWTGLDATARATALHDFTADALQRLEDASVDVAMVQIGNETNNGVAGYTRAGTAIDQTFANLISAGSSAVREVLPGVPVAVHFTNPETAGRYATYAAGLAQFGVDYDVFASSYYPYWHGTTENLTNVLSHIATTYGKKVMVAETSWARTLEDGDGFPNVIGSGTISDDYPVSVQGQATQLRDVIAAVAAVGAAGLGVYYWEPAWLPVGPPSEYETNALLWERDGSGWATSYASSYDPVHVGEFYGGSAWDNQSLFAWDGKPLESLRTFQYVDTGAVAPREIVAVEQPALSFQEGSPVTLPETIAVDYNDGTTEHPAVTWSGAVHWIRGPGVYEIPGATSTGLEVVATVTVLAVNYVENHSFEYADMSAWTLTGPAARTQTSDSSDGDFSVTFWNGTAYTASVQQTITGVPAGTYLLQATTQGTNSPSTDTRTLTATTSAGSESAPLEFSTWNEFHTSDVDGVVVGADGTVTVSASFSLSAGAWGVVDDFRLVRASTTAPVDTSDLETLLIEARAIDLTPFTPASAAALEEAIAIADVVVAASEVTAKDVKSATKLLEKGVKKLNLTR